MIEAAIKQGQAYDHVLIVGGGDLVIATKILKEYPLVRKVTVCEIDPRVVEVTKKYFSFAEIVAAEIASGRLEVVIESGATYLSKLYTDPGRHGKVGGVIVDCTDFALNEDSLSSELFTPDFYKEIFHLLESGGGFSQQITDLVCKDEFTKRAKLGGFEGHGMGIIMAATPEYGGELPIAYCFKPP